MESLIFLILIVIFGYACLTSGYHLLPLLYGAAGFAAGLCLWRYLHPGLPWVSEPSMVVALCGAFLGAVLHEYLMMALVFGLILARFPHVAVNVTLFGVGVVCALGCAVLFRKLFRPCMVIFTAVVGAAILSQALVSIYWYAKQPSVGITGLSNHLAASLVTPPGHGTPCGSCSASCSGRWGSGASGGRSDWSGDNLPAFCIRSQNYRADVPGRIMHEKE